MRPRRICRSQARRVRSCSRKTPSAANDNPKTVTETKLDPSGNTLTDVTSLAYYLLTQIVSRKFAQLSEVQLKTAIGYVNAISAKYPVGATVVRVPLSRELAGQSLQGQYMLEVPVQMKPVPQSVLDAANKSGVLIRDVNGTVY